jgi:hypothetical protein
MKGREPIMTASTTTTKATRSTIPVLFMINYSFQRPAHPRTLKGWMLVRFLRTRSIKRVANLHHSNRAATVSGDQTVDTDWKLTDALAGGMVDGAGDR